MKLIDASRAKACAALLAVVLGLAAGGFGCAADKSADEASTPDKAAALAVDVTPPTPIANAELQEALEQATGKVVVANFWATWCPPCVAEMPELAKFYEQYKDKEVVFLSLSVNSMAEFEAGKVTAFMKEHRLPFPVRVISERDPGAIATVLKADWQGMLPTTFVIGPTGELAKQFDGEVTAADVAGAVDPLLAANPV